jgi:exonuclease SbcC
MLVENGFVMKPLRLTVQAFGPYVGREVIDFTRLSGGGLFLIHGHTGAGKTSVLDGLCFALFGKSSGADRVGEGMRCHLSTPDTGTEVCLEFSLGEDLYRILRRPKQELNKKRGTGTTVSEPFGELYRGRAARVATDAFDLDRIEWTPVATGTQKTLDAVTALLGMNDEQFCQIVILPQGQFRKFLAAGSTEREKILEILFQTNRFRAATETLVFAAKKIEDQYQEKRLLLSGQMQALEVSDFSALQTTLDQLKNQRDGLAKEGSDLSAEHKLKSDRLTAARDWNNHDSEVAKNAAAFTEIERQQPMIAGQVEKLRLHDRSAPVLAAELHLHRLVTEKHAIDERGLVEVTQQMDLARELVQWQARAEQQAQQMPKVQSQRSEMDRLAERQHQAEKLISTKKLLDQYRTDLQNSVRACQSSESEIAALNASHESKTKEQQTHATCAGERAHFLTIRSLLEQERQSLHEAMKLSADLKRFLQAQSTLADEARTLTGQVESLKVEFRKMKRDFHLSMAAQLAAELQEEMPCKVCGSLSHPSPASMPEGAPTQVALEMSEMNLQKEESRLVALQKRLVKAESEIGSRRDELSRRLGQEHITDGTIENLLSAKQRLINENEAAIAKTEKASISAARLAEEIKNFEKNLQLRREAAAAQLRKREEITLKLEATAAAINEIEAMLPPEYRDLLALTARDTKPPAGVAARTDREQKPLGLAQRASREQG